MTDILDPLSFRTGLTARNRVALAPMTNLQSHKDGTLSDDELRWLEARARGGFGVVTTCAAHVGLDGQGWPGELGVYDDAMVPGLTRLASALHGHGALAMVQIFHGGARAPSAVTGAQPWSASVFTDQTPGFEPVRAGTEDEIARAIDQFAKGAARCAKAGFDGVEIHGAHGYLLSQFLSRTMNTRTDGWGGSFENRARLMREVTRAVRAAVPKEFLVGVRLSPEDFGQAHGLDLDENVTLAKWLCDDGADFLHLSLWRFEKNTKARPESHPIPLFRAAIPAEVRVLAAGNIWTRDDAQRALDLGADMVALGRSAICNPRWPDLVVREGGEPVRPPISRDALRERALSDGFIDYMKRWKGFVDEA